MKLFAIGDLHFSTAVDKPMCKFGDNWIDHDKKIVEDWKKNVKEEDTVLVVGDISWATRMDEAMVDLDIIDNLPGKKYLIKGNHDYWWSTSAKLNKLYDDMTFMNTEFLVWEHYAICGTRGWLCPNEVKFDESDEKIYKREAKRIELSIQKAKKAGFDKIIVMLHYPPTNEKFERSLFTDVFEKYKVQKVIYGHLHGKSFFSYGVQGNLNGVEYILASSDYLGFKVKEITT